MKDELKPKMVQIPLPDGMYKELLKLKGKKTWYAFIRGILFENRENDE